MGHFYTPARGNRAIFCPKGTSRPPKGRRAKLEARGRPGSARGAKNEPCARGMGCRNHILIHLTHFLRNYWVWSDITQAVIQCLHNIQALQQQGQNWQYWNPFLPSFRGQKWQYWNPFLPSKGGQKWQYWNPFLPSKGGQKNFVRPSFWRRREGERGR